MFCLFSVLPPICNHRYYLVFTPNIFPTLPLHQLTEQNSDNIHLGLFVDLRSHLDGNTLYQKQKKRENTTQTTHKRNKRQKLKSKPKLKKKFLFSDSIGMLNQTINLLLFSLRIISHMTLTLAVESKWPHSIGIASNDVFLGVLECTSKQLKVILNFLSKLVHFYV